jgi:hypothetical protein
MTYTILVCIIGAMAGLIVHLTRERAYWKHMAMAEGRKRLTKDDEREAEHNAEIHRLNTALRKSDEKIAELIRKNNVLRQLNEQLAKQHNNDTMRQLEELVKKKEETTCP